jgi:SAM-dependent methyltransferase
MQYVYKALYLDLLPPTPFLREINKIVSVSCFLWLCTSVVWSVDLKDSRMFGGVVLQGVITDALGIASAIYALWYGFLLVISTWKLKHYRAASFGASTSIYQLLWPWFALWLLNSLVFIAVFTFTFAPSSPYRAHLFGTLLTIALSMGLLEIPGLKNLIPKLEPLPLFRIFRKSLPILLGREAGETVEDHAKKVVEFQGSLMGYIVATSSGSDGQAKETMPIYFDPHQLKAFQDTLGCRYSTSEKLAELLRGTFSGRTWNMVDIGCGEGVFTANFLKKLDSQPNAIFALDPARENLEQYRRAVEALSSDRRSGCRTPSIDTVVGTIEDRITRLPSANLVLASHSLYALLDNDRKKAAEVVSQLISKTSGGQLVFILASESSYLYTVKREILGELHRPDRSTYGEDLRQILPGGCKVIEGEPIDSFVDVTELLLDRNKLLSWAAYFCRLGADDLNDHFEVCERIVRNAAIEVGRLPTSERDRYKTTPRPEEFDHHLDDDSRSIVYHREVMIRIPC